MLTAITHHQVWVFDQDEALDFYVGKLGFEIHTDAQLEIMRWLTVNVPGQPDREVMLLVPQPPAVDPDAIDEVRALVSKGACGTMILATDDCRGDYERLVANGVEFTEEPTERFYGTDCALRDPFGNPIRMTQPAPVPAESGNAA
jgi:catechol 2,3-dioxygenase-like lactoylglutathione lyase family enzyme